jgi:NitT/TauT family transport system substrate-binding protein
MSTFLELTDGSQSPTMTRRRIVALLLGGLPLGILAACSSPTTTSGPTVAPTSAAAPPVTPKPAGSPAAAASPSAGRSPVAATSPVAAASPASSSAIRIAPAAPGPKTNVESGISVQVYSYTPIYVAQEKGFWEQQNLNVKVNIFKSGAEQQQAVLADSIMVGGGGCTEVLTLAARGVPTRVFSFIQNALVYKLVAKPEIKTVADLRGKTMAISSSGALSEQIIRICLAKLGHDPNMVKYQQAGGSPQRFAALQAGAVDGTILDAPSNQLAQRAGYNVLVNVPDLLPGFPYEVGYAKQETIDKNRDVFVRYMRGYISGALFVNDPRNKAEVIAIAAKYLDMKPEDSQLAYDDVIGFFPPDGRPTVEGIRLAIEGVQQFGNIPGSDKLTADELFYPDLVNAALSS